MKDLVQEGWENRRDMVMSGTGFPFIAALTIAPIPVLEPYML